MAGGRLAGGRRLEAGWRPEGGWRLEFSAGEAGWYRQKPREDRRMNKNDNVLQGVECPECSSQGPFKLTVTVRGTATVSDDGWDDLCSTNSVFVVDAPARCLGCSYEAPFGAFMEYEDDCSEGLILAGMAHGNRGLADYGGLHDGPGECGHHCSYDCPRCGEPG